MIILYVQQIQIATTAGQEEHFDLTLLFTAPDHAMSSLTSLFITSNRTETRQNSQQHHHTQTQLRTTTHGCACAAP